MASYTTYMERISDLEHPVDLKKSPLADAILNPPRSSPKEQLKERNVVQEKKVWKRGTSKNDEKCLEKQYWEHIVTPANTQYGANNLSDIDITTIIPEKAWVVPNLLTPDECDYFIKEGERFGLFPPRKELGVEWKRTSKRTNNFCAPELSKFVISKLPNELLEKLEETKPYASFRGIHPNWRIAKYETNDFFAAHYDQADSITVKDDAKPRGKARFDSFQTLLISLSDRSNFEGGATRFFPMNKYDDTAIDVELPRGYALVFAHRLLHAGLPPISGTKYIAQAGILRDEPERVIGSLSTFKFGPGLTFSSSAEASTYEHKMKRMDEDGCIIGK